MILHIWWGLVVLLSITVVVGGIGLFVRPTFSYTRPQRDLRSVAERWLDHRHERREREAREAAAREQEIDRLPREDA